jgi:2-polyprenyl-3-methyl-5-hydroxy-6-metoxy-1,4-benzoquinol methylase
MNSPLLLNKKNNKNILSNDGLTCRFCETPLRHSVADLGMSPLSNAYISPAQKNQAEKFYPLHAYVCEQCFLVQLAEFESPEVIFSDYAYFSSYSDSWLLHCKRYTAEAIQRFGLTKDSQVLELASNDGYLLQYFKEAGIPVLGVEPSANVAQAAEAKGIPTLVRFFGTETAGMLVQKGFQADLLIANNVLAHVPDLRDFVAGIQMVLKPEGVFTIEFPHLLQLLQNNQFDTIYHEHFSYFSLLTVQKVFQQAGLSLFDVEELPTHGGSLRIYGCPVQSERAQQPAERVATLLLKEHQAGLDKLETYTGFHEKIQSTKRQFLKFLLEANQAGRKVAAYGAPAKGNTLLNYCGVRSDLIRFTVDRNPHKQGYWLPGTRIPVLHPEAIEQEKPDFVVILPWNLREEIMQQLAYIRSWGGKFVIPIPTVEVLE